MFGGVVFSLAAALFLFISLRLLFGVERPDRVLGFPRELTGKIELEENPDIDISYEVRSDNSTFLSSIKSRRVVVDTISRVRFVFLYFFDDLGLPFLWKYL